MITIILALKGIDGSLESHILRLCEILHIIRHLCANLFLTNATNGGKFGIHRYILKVIQLAEDTELGELGYTGNENELKMRVRILQRRIEISHYLAQLIQTILFVRHIEQRRIVFVNKHHHFLAR